MSAPLLDTELDKVYTCHQRRGLRLRHAGQLVGVYDDGRYGPAAGGHGHHPRALAGDKTISRTKRDLYQYYAILMEPWDGPASILFSDGDVVGAVLDRNGLRPSRYYVTSTTA